MEKRFLAHSPQTLREGYLIKLLLPSDIDDIVFMLRDEQVTRYLPFAPAPESVYRDYFLPIAEQNEAALSGKAEPSITLIIREAESNHFAGMLGLVPAAMTAGVYEVGFQLPQRAWGKGLASQGCQMLIQYAFDQLDAHKVTADCYANNTGSERVMMKSGMVKEGHQAGYYAPDEDRVIYGLTRKQYLNL
ncbi:GNAT family N-acetyltransferase [Endozoicomonas arenosclerae]|uniref:GNAT family N-acetyltransferase n=1 Tax=Endozoicomonas arenosclerae TaxID=1633495 RepID=UPI0009A22171|nr:GNAT family protein [Endozoicomonas arenosclerae]